MPFVALAPASRAVQAGPGRQLAGPPFSTARPDLAPAVDSAAPPARPGRRSGRDHRARASAEAVAAAEVPRRQARARRARRSPASRFRCRSPHSNRPCCAFAKSCRAAAPARPPSTSAPPSSRRRHRCRFVARRFAGTRSSRPSAAGGAHRGLAPDLLWLVAELAVSPFVHALQRTLLVRQPAKRRSPTALARLERTATARRAARGRRWRKSREATACSAARSARWPGS